MTKLGGPPPFDPSRYQSDKKVDDEEILEILQRPLARNTGGKNKNKKKKKAKKEDGDAAEAEAEEAEEPTEE